MKTNKIVRKESVNGGSMFTLTFEAPIADFDINQVGGCVLNTFKNGVNTTEADLSVGDAITDDFGGEPVIADTHVGVVETTELKARENDYRDVFQNKRHV